MSKQKQPLSPGIFLSILIITVSGLDSLHAPHDVVKFCGASSYWGVVGAFIIFLPIIFLLLIFQKRFPTMNLFEAAKLCIGKYMAVIGNFLYLMVFIIWFMVGLRDATDLTMSYLLDITPLWVVQLSFMAVIGYLAINGLTGVGRMAAFTLTPI